MLNSSNEPVREHTSDTNAHASLRQHLSDRRRLCKLDYTIHGSSGHSVGYSPERILEDCPEDQASRWSSPSNDQHQFLILQLCRPSILATITFGKFNKLHVCNLREFEVWAGPDATGMTRVLHSGLRNDTEPETFTVRYDLAGEATAIIPVRFVKIVPLASHGSNFNFSIWYVELRGISDPGIVQSVCRRWEARMDREAWRLCLDFVRRHPEQVSPTLYRQLVDATGVQVEDLVLQQIFESLISGGPLACTERLVADIPRDMLEVLSEGRQYKVSWEKIVGPSAKGPPGRGGHQMAWDPVGQLIWLFGGWDGKNDLGDLWSFNPATREWRCVQEDCSQSGGPCARSCHTIAVDAKRRSLLVLGRFVDLDYRTDDPLHSELLSYNLDTGSWTCLSGDTAQDGGPLLLYDHQMVVENCRCVAACSCPSRLWVYGGKVVSNAHHEAIYSGLWTCDISQTQLRWRLVRPDDPSVCDLRVTPTIRSRIGHCMLFDPDSRLLHILHGQRLKDYFGDYHQYNVDTDTVVRCEKDVSGSGGPNPGFTQRGCIVSPEPGVKLVVLLSGLVREKAGAEADLGTAPQLSYDHAQNALWSLDLASSTWTLLYANNSKDLRYWREMSDKEPCPRFAHQLINADRYGVFLFGGNPGDGYNPRLRLDDMWNLTLQRASDAASTQRHLLYLVRRQQFKELCREAKASGTSPVTALHYLQNEVAEVVGPEDAAGFERLSSLLFVHSSKEPLQPVDPVKERLAVYEEIAGHFGHEQRPPRHKLPELLLM